MKHNHINDNYLDHLLEIFVSYLLSPPKDGAWRGVSVLARLIEFQGDIPRGTGNDQSNETMIRAIDKWKKDHAELNKITCSVYKLLGSWNSNKQMLALLGLHYYGGRHNKDTGKEYTQYDIYQEVYGMSYETDKDKKRAAERLGDRSKAGRILLEAELYRFERNQAA